MMTFLFEQTLAPATGGVPIDLLLRHQRDVSLLDFMILSDSAGDSPVEEEEAAADEPAFVADERAAQIAAMIDAAREETAVFVRQQMKHEMDALRTEQQRRVEQIAHEYAADRQRYFAAAEIQVVRLAVAVAERVLAREVKGDALHLAAVVKAALTQVKESGLSKLKVHPDDVEGWAEFLKSDSSVEVVGDEGSLPGECVLETSIGRVEFGVDIQLAEVKRSFGMLADRQGV